MQPEPGLSDSVRRKSWANLADDGHQAEQGLLADSAMPDRACAKGAAAVDFQLCGFGTTQMAAGCLRLGSSVTPRQD